MREAWRVEPLHSTHQGQHLDDLLLQLLQHGRALELDAAFDGSPSSSSSSSSPSSSRDGGSSSASDDDNDRRELVLAAAAQGVLGGHVFPLFPGPAAAFAPVCCDMPTLQAGRAEGYRSAQRLVAAIHTLDRMPAAGHGAGASLPLRQLEF
jgi:hypothetical protein